MSDEQIRVILDQDKSANNSLSQTSHNILVLIETINKELESIANPSQDNRSEEIKKRFIISEDGQTIYDSKTNLTWDRDFKKSGELSWDSAEAYTIKKLSRIPRSTQYQTLASLEKYPSISELEAIGFLNIPGATWTGDVQFLSTDRWSLDFRYLDSLGNDHRNNKHYVICVHKTRISLEEIKARFILSEDKQRIYDNRSGLSWDRDFKKSGELGWDNASSYAQKNSSKLPSINDWETLEFSIEELEAIGFLNVPKVTWTSQEDYSRANGVAISLSSSTNMEIRKSAQYYVVCVR